MFDDQREAEPDEYDPEDDLTDYETELPNVPEAPKPMPASEAPPEVSWAFWRTVLAVNVSVLAFALAPMLAYFEGEYGLALRLVGVGVVTGGYAYWVYYRFMHRDD